jgi:glycosyltransferase involved in cell wall biosynthesis
MLIEPAAHKFERTPALRIDGGRTRAAGPSELQELDQLQVRNHPNYPLITIGIPTRNRASLLQDCVVAALAQSYRNIEVLVSDNASTDDTLAVLGSIEDDRLRVLSSTANVGAGGNFAKCIGEARGDYLVLVSDDNFLDPTFLEKCVRLIRMEPGLPIVLAAYDVVVFDEYYENEERLVPGVLSTRFPTGLWDGAEILGEYLNGRFTADSLSVVVRTDILRRYNRYYRYRCAGDKATWMPALLEGHAGLVNERCAMYMAHGSSVSAGISADDRISEFCMAMGELAADARQTISDPATRRQIRALTWRYLAYQTMVTLVLYRREGASLVDVARKLWRWRPMLQRCTVQDFLATLRLRSLARIVLPAAVTRWSIALGLDRLI